MQTFLRLQESIKENIEIATILYKEKLYQEFADKNIFVQKEIVLNSIAYAKIKEDANSAQAIINNYAMEPDNEIYLSEDIPDSLVEELYEHVKITIEKSREFFSVEPSQTGRYDLLFKGVLHCIKLINTDIEKGNTVIYSMPENVPLDLTLEKIVDLQIDKIIDIAITFCKCYEADSKHNHMCREVLNKNFRDYYKYQYKLDPTTYERLKKDIDFVIYNLSHKDQYTCYIRSSEYNDYLKNTIELTRTFINKLIEESPNMQTKDFQSLIKTYNKIFQNSKERFESPKKTSAFFQTLKKCHMDRRMQYNDKIIFPFLFDLIVMSFAFSVVHTQYKDTYTDSNKVAKAFNNYKYAYLEPDSDENYHFNEFIRATEEIPKEYKKLDDPTILMIKHYSEILNCKYTTLASLFRQLRFQFPDNEKSVYNLLQAQRNIDLNFDDDYFRKLSLYII